MKRLRLCALLLAVLFVLGAVGCSLLTPRSQQGPTQQSTAAQSRQQPTATQPAPQPTSAQPAAQPTVEEEEMGEVVPPELAENITSYRQTLKMQSTLDGKTEIAWNSLTEWVKSIPARRVFVQGTGDDGQPFEWEMIQIGDASYMRFGDEWVVVAGGQEPPTNETLAWTDPNVWKDDTRCSYKGKETLNGMQVKHWHCDKDVFAYGALMPIAGGQIEDGRIDSWVSTEFEVAVKTEIEWKGKNAEGKPATFVMMTEVYDINKPFAIEAPEGVDLPGLPDDVPMMDDATEVVAVGQMVSYKVAVSVEDAIAFYTAAMPDNGWEAGEEGFVPGMLSFTKGERSAQIMITEDGATAASVTVIVQGE